MQTPSDKILCAYTEREVPFNRLEPDRREIYLMMGSPAYDPDSAMTDAVEGVLDKMKRICRPRYGYTIVSAGQATEHGKITAGDVEMNPGRTITRFLGDAGYFAVFTATAGAEFEQWMRTEASSGDILREFVASNVGSEIAEAAARVMAVEIEEMVAANAVGCGNPYSPGYCGWNVAEQHKLFSLLPRRPCGIVLNDSGLMVPIKSVSGIIPIGVNVRKMPYGCAICNKKDCYKNKAK